jgi:hypothetical protein
VFAAAQQLQVGDRDGFLQAVAEALKGRREIGDGDFFGRFAAAQRRHFDPPLDDTKAVRQRRPSGLVATPAQDCLSFRRNSHISLARSPVLVTAMAYWVIGSVTSRGLYSITSSGTAFIGTLGQPSDGRMTQNRTPLF